MACGCKKNKTTSTTTTTQTTSTNSQTPQNINLSMVQQTTTVNEDKTLVDRIVDRLNNLSNTQ